MNRLFASSIVLALFTTAILAVDSFVLPEFDDPPSKSNTEISPANFKPIEATTTKVDEPKPAIKGSSEASLIPQKLNRPIRVGVFLGVRELYLIRNGEEIRITSAGNKIRFQGKNASMEVESKEIYAEGSCISISTSKSSLKSSCYSGYFSIVSNKGKIYAINILDMEEYIRGVIPYEIGALDKSRFEALKAQAVAARTYAYKHYGGHESLGFDVYADTKDQVYKGRQNATSLTDSAVMETAGEVMTYNGEFITSYYHSTCGGKTETMDTWGSKDIPYLKSKDDLRPNGTPWCNESSYSSWERKFSDTEIQTLVKKNAGEVKAKIRDFSTVSNIVVKDILPSGRILTLQVVTDKGMFEVHGDKTRWLFKNKGSILPSSLFTIKHQNGQWILTGSGFGHGVGMCQMGVRARAKAGQKYDEILKHYYTGITIQRFIK